MTELPRNPFRFGIIGRGSSPLQWRDMASRAEGYGYSTLLVPEHLDDPYSSLILMSTALEATTTLRVGSQVFCNDLHNPTLLARAIATLDVFYNGRTELGIGAGNRPMDVELAGLPFHSAGQRIEHLEVSVRGIKELFISQNQDAATSSRAPYSGKLAFPEIVQRPHPPIYMGGGGKKMLGVAARQANIIGITAKASAHGHLDINDMSPEVLREKLDWIRAAAGERFLSLELSMPILGVALTEQQLQLLNPILWRRYRPASQISLECHWNN
ncbi:LLM class flavin-dependent oxidoreductase [Dictyobacter kobayashii]|uniref:Luciferase-like domain-containing protein n=1 Tax=Dictyobacter kobayashii TaxID=2014872 RepID=A0A402AM17_9CHLR|nr:LLM class flavin-dependent oxidoreductase [Dictyobacter kobayashii]GCE20153.1 hypothetical protein KDK_39530 [Dictyobacter kobayashii]